MLFLEKFPLFTVIKDCEFSNNRKNGCFIQDYWKGPIFILNSKFIENSGSGINISSKDYPITLSKAP